MYCHYHAVPIAQVMSSFIDYLLLRKYEYNMAKRHDSEFMQLKTNNVPTHMTLIEPHYLCMTARFFVRLQGL